LDEPAASAEPTRDAPGATVLAWPLPPGALLSSELASLDLAAREKLALELARALGDLATLGTIWPDLSPDLIWIAPGKRPVPLAVWRAFRRASPPAPSAWTAACAAPECARGETPTEASQTYAWAKLASL